MKHFVYLFIFFLAATYVSDEVFAQRNFKRPARPGRTNRNDDAPKVGDTAPLFKLLSLDGKDETDLASFRNKRPVVLFFGSYT
ncbi:MAG: hypothetical protein ACE5HS_10900 [bacterium]